MRLSIAAAVLLASVLVLGCLQSSSVLPGPSDGVIADSGLTPAPSSLATLRASEFSFPTWAYEARLAGFAFYPDFSDEDILEKVDAAVAQNVSVMLMDTPLGWDYRAWENDDEFEANRKLVRNVAQMAHRRGLKVALYLTGLEVTGPAGVDPLADHPDWLQQDQAGRPVQFDDIGSTQEHWLETGEVDAWLSPESSYRDFFLNRTRSLAPLVDALWVDTVYLQNSIGLHDDLWPSHDAFSVAAFKADRGVEPPRRPDWGNSTWNAWILWRQKSVSRFLADIQTAARQANPDVLVFAENWNVDSPLSTGYAQDPSKVGLFLPTAPEISTVADRVDLGERAMGSANLDQWRAFAAMVAYSVSANRGAPTWTLTYGATANDALKMAGVVLAFGGQFYEARGPSMLDDSVDPAFRKALFSWAAKESAVLAQGRTAKVALWYSSNARDFMDQNDAGFYEERTPFFKSYRQAAKMLLNRHVPYDVVFDAERVDSYDLVVVPSACVSESEFRALQRKTRVVFGDVLDAGCEHRLVMDTNAALPEGLDLPDDVFYSETQEASFLANVGSRQSVSLPIPSGKSRARFSTLYQEATLFPIQGNVLTPAFEGPALLEWLP